jgi:hypothetical protein
LLLLFILQTHTEDFAKENATALLFSSSMKGSGHCLPGCFTFALLQYLINASGSSTTSVKFYSPNPEGSFKTTHLFHA